MRKKQDMNLMLLPDLLAVCRFPVQQEIPAWVWSQKTFLSVTYTHDELSIVCFSQQLPAEMHGVNCERDWCAIKIQGPLAFSLTGILASLLVPLAAAGVAVFALSTFDTDYVLVKHECCEQTRRILEQEGHRFVDGVFSRSAAGNDTER